MKYFLTFLGIFSVSCLSLLILSRCGILEGSPASPYRTYYGAQSLVGNWQWNLNYTTSTWEARVDNTNDDNVYDETIKGTFKVLNNGFIKLTTKEVGISGYYHIDDIAYAVEIPGLALFVKPSTNYFAGKGSLISATSIGKCDNIQTTYNWVQVAPTNTFSPPLNNPLFGKAILSGTSEDPVIQIKNYNLDGSDTPYASGGNQIVQGTCLFGKTTLQSPPNGNGVISGGAGILNQRYVPEHAHLGFVAKEVTSKELANKSFIGFLMRTDASGIFSSNGINSSVYKYQFNDDGTVATGYEYFSNNVESDVIDTINPTTFTIQSNNLGFIQGSVLYPNAQTAIFGGFVHSYSNRYVLGLETAQQTTPINVALLVLISK